MQQESHRHHFVPEFLMKPWAIDGEVNGFGWDERIGRFFCKRKGPKAFCHEIDLLMLERHEKGRDVLEREYFGDVDSKGALVRDRLVTVGPESLTHDERCDFARLLLSLEARRPAIVRRLRDGAQYLAEEIDIDLDIQRGMKQSELSGTASEFLTAQGFSFEDRALSNIQKLVDDPQVGGTLINMRWRVKHLGPDDSTLVLSDRPLVRLNGYDHPDAGWFLPLDPTSAFCAVNDPRELDKTTPRRFARLLNANSARQAEKFVFCIDHAHKQWLTRYLSIGSSKTHTPKCFANAADE